MNLHCTNHHSTDIHLGNSAPKCEACILSTKFAVHVDAGSLCNILRPQVWEPLLGIISNQVEQRLRTFAYAEAYLFF